MTPTVNGPWVVWRCECSQLVTMGIFLITASSLRVMTLWNYCSSLMFVTTSLHPPQCLCVGAYITKCVASLSCSVTLSHSVVFGPREPDCGWICWKHVIIIRSFSFVPLFIFFFLLLVQSSPTIPLCPGIRSRAWATSGHSLSISATCRMTQRTSAWLGRRSASLRFLSKVYESLSLEKSFQEGAVFLLGLANAVIWALRGLTALFPSCHLCISILLCCTVTCCALLSAHSFLMGMWRVKFSCFVYCHVSLSPCCLY